MKLNLKRSEKNPILVPTENWWENRLVCNPGVIKLEDKIYLIYTAHGQDDRLARFGYARLKGIDEVEERLRSPIFQPEEWFEENGTEDPRLVVMEDKIFMLYAGKEKDMARVCESYISVSDFLKGDWAWSRHRLILPIMVGIHNRNAAYFPRRIEGRLLMLHRPMTMAENIWLSYSYDRIHWYDHKEILKTRSGYWDDAKVGVAGPPIELEEGTTSGLPFLFFVVILSLDFLTKLYRRRKCKEDLNYWLKIKNWLEISICQMVLKSLTQL